MHVVHKVQHASYPINETMVSQLTLIGRLPEDLNPPQENSFEFLADFI